MILESCDSIFSTDSLKSESALKWSILLESIFPDLMKMENNNKELYFSRIQSPSDLLSGIYDYSFSIVDFNGKRRLLWIIIDNTNFYKDLTRFQQSKNEAVILKQAINHLTNSNKENIKDFKKRFLYTKNAFNKTPETALNGLIALYSAITKKKTSKAYAHSVKTSESHVKFLIEELVNIKDKQDQNFVLGSEKFNISDLVHQLKKQYEKSENTAELRFEIDQGIPNELMGDPERLTQILSELLTQTRETRSDFIELSLDQVPIKKTNQTAVKFSLTAKKKLFSNASFEKTTFSKSLMSGLEFTIFEKIIELLNGEFDLERFRNHNNQMVFWLPFRLPTS